MLAGRTPGEGTGKQRLRPSAPQTVRSAPGAAAQTPRHTPGKPHHMSHPAGPAQTHVNACLAQTIPTATAASSRLDGDVPSGEQTLLVVHVSNIVSCWVQTIPQAASTCSMVTRRVVSCSTILHAAPYCQKLLGHGPLGHSPLSHGAP